MKKIFAFLLIISLFVSGCSFTVDVLTPAPPLTPVPTWTATSPVATISPTAALFTPTPTPIAPLFTGVFFITDSTTSQNGKIFPVGTKQVHAVWNYMNMQAGLMVKREWYLNGQLWLTREEAWDFSKYGAHGSIDDVSIYDFDDGLPSGVYDLRIYIDNVIQAIGTSANGQPDTKATFEIRSNGEAQAGTTSPDYQWSVEVFGEQRIVLRDKDGNTTSIFTAREVPYITWFPDSKHFLFVDRDRSDQQSGTTIGIRDDLWLVDVPSGRTHLLYENDLNFSGRAGPMPSPDGRYIASLTGSGYADACFIDTRMIFFEVSSDFQSVRTIPQEQFAGFPDFTEGSIYPVEDGFWQTGSEFKVTLDALCNSDRQYTASYLFDMINRTAAKSSSASAGDLGVGMIHGTITDVDGEPVTGVSVTCEQHSHTASPLCSGTVLSNADGAYAFNNVHFHDTDTIKLTLQAAGYQTQEFSWNAFTTNDFPVDFVLYRVT